ncbi:MAG: S8 family serine peptidase [Bacteroidia bacterium]|nr:S8 family serine peptidase [Bacteroidia bacterium]
MKPKSLLFLISLLLIHTGLFAQAEMNVDKVDPTLISAIEQNAEAFYPVYILLEDQLDMIEMNENFNKLKTSLEDRSYIAINALQAKAASTQGPLLNYLHSLPGVEPASIQAFWITNVIYAELNGSAVKDLSKRIDVGQLELVVLPKVEEMKNTKMLPARPAHSVGGHEVGHTVINAPAMWSLGYTGAGRKILVIDTGVDGGHPALKYNYWGNFVPHNQAWFAVSSKPEPEDCTTSSHGSHVTGIAVGLDRITHDTIGVAFNAAWMGAAAIQDEPSCTSAASTISAMQWAINPDGNASTITDRPDVVNNSWGGDTASTMNPALCTSATVSAVNSLEAVGIAVIKSAGNLGELGPQSLPASGYANFTLVNAFAVGAINGFNPNLPRASFSSQGPSICGGTGSLLIKPEVVAPGVNIRSSIIGGYAQYEGTSMSAPMVSGAFLLLKEAFPTLTGEQIKLALYYSAVDLGPAGEDNQYGMGLIDVLAAYNYLISQGNTPVTTSLDKDAMVVSVEQQGEGICDSVIIPEILVRNNGKTAFTSLEIAYEISDGTSGTYTWNGNLSPSQSQTILLPTVALSKGYYTIDIEITKVDGATDPVFVDNLGSGSFALLGDDTPVSSPINVCNGSQGMLTATSPSSDVTFKWYESPSSTTYVGEGSSFITPTLTGNKSYYVASVTQFNLGMAAKELGAGFFVQQNTSYLIFDVKYPVFLKSVKVYAGAAGSRTFLLRSSNGTTLGSRIVNLVAGEQRVDLNFAIPIGEGYQLGLGGSTGNLYSNASGYTFPLDYNGVISITGSNNTLYHHFYDWEVEYESPCGRAFTFATVSSGNVVAGFTASDTTVDISDASSVKFTNTSTGATTYLWSFGDGTTSTDANPSHNYFAPGEYLVGLSSSGSSFCSDAVAMTIHVTGDYPYNVAIEDDIYQFGRITVYPNPGSGAFNLVFELDRRYETEIGVYDQLGKKVLNFDKTEYQNDQLQLDLSGQSNGIYYLRIGVGGQSVVKKLVKTHQ